MVLMETVAVGARWNLAEVPLPALGSSADRPSLGFEMGFQGLFLADESRDPILRDVEDRAGEARWMAAQQARYERRLADTYLRGAAELAFRSNAATEAQRREWGARCMLAELACALRVPETTLASRLTRITMLEAFPKLSEAARSGLVSGWHLDAVLEAFRGVSDPAVLAAADAVLVERALTRTAPELRAAARRWRARHVPRTQEQRRANLAHRHVSVTPADEDMVWLTALIPAVAGVAIDRRLDALAVTAAAGCGDDDGDGPDGRSHIQARADAFVDLLLDPAAAGDVRAPFALTGPDVAGGEAGFGWVQPAEGGAPLDAAHAHGGRLDDGVDAEHADGAEQAEQAEHAEHAEHAEDARVPVPGWVYGVRPEVVLTIPVLSLLGRSDEPAELEGFGPIDLDTARLLTASAPSFTTVLTDPHTGAVLSVGRTRYRIPADLRRVVQLRDRTCRFPGCRRRAKGCDIDHTKAWQHGGATDICNLACLCRRHHTLKHEMRWQVSQQPGGVLDWTSALGRHYTTHPEALWPNPPPAPSPGRSAGTDPPGAAAVNSSGYPDEPPF
jgi:hypothetical protein